MFKKDQIKFSVSLNFLLLVSGLIMFQSCTEVIPLELNDGDNQKLVVDAWITNEPGNQKVILTKTTSYFHNQPAPRATGGVVTLSAGNEVFSLVEKEKGDYRLPDDFVGREGTTYTLKIILDGITYESSATLNPVTPIDSLGYTLEFNEADNYVVLLYAQEPEGVGDYYLFRTFKNGSLIADTLRNADFASDEFVDGNYIGGVEIGYEDLKIGDMAYIEVLSISEEANDFFLAIMLETDWRGGPFDTPPANIPTNISNGALGFFNASAIVRDSILIE